MGKSKAKLNTTRGVRGGLIGNSLIGKDIDFHYRKEGTRLGQSAAGERIRGKLDLCGVVLVLRHFRGGRKNPRPTYVVSGEKKKNELGGDAGGGEE